jgi:hypothetical protein
VGADSKCHILKAAIGKAAWMAVVGMFCEYFEALKESFGFLLGISCCQEVQERIVTNAVVRESIGSMWCCGHD